MKKILSIALALVMALGAVLAGCGRQEAAQADITAAADTLMEKLAFKDEMKEIDASILKNFYSSIDQSTLNGFVLYKSSSGATAEEVALFEAKDAQGVKEIQEAVNMRLEDLTLQFEDYVPAEMKKIESAVVETYGNVVALVIADDAAQAEELLDGLF